jgi:hypothetical protein
MSEKDRKYNLELDWEEVTIIVEALGIQRERWEQAVLTAMAGQPVMGVSLTRANELLGRHSKLLDRLPDHGLTI